MSVPTKETIINNITDISNIIAALKKLVFIVYVSGNIIFKIDIIIVNIKHAIDKYIYIFICIIDIYIKLFNLN
jgi:hypothetical protein